MKYNIVNITFCFNVWFLVLAKHTCFSDDQTWNKFLVSDLEAMNYTSFEKIGSKTRSSMDCASKCAASVDCEAFCFYDVTSACYVVQITTVTSFNGQPANETNPNCFAKPGIICPASAGYSLHSGRCVRLFAAPEVYLRARQICSQDGAHLYHVKEDADRETVTGFLNETGTVLQTAWVGADDIESEGNYVWSDGTAVQNFWHHFEPNNWAQAENCVMMSLSLGRNLTLNDIRCAIEQPFLCQIDLSQ